MYGLKPKIETDLLSNFFASTCALTIGLNLSWSPLNKAEGQPLEQLDFADSEQENVMVIMYLVAIGWSQWSGFNVGLVGPFALMAFGVAVSVCAGALASAFPCHVYCVYVVRALQGFGCASLAVAVPEYIMASNKDVTGPYQSSILCLIEVFIIVGQVISYSLSILVTWTLMNLLTTGIISLNIFSLILLRITSQRHDDRMTVCYYHGTSNSVGPYSELLRDTNNTKYTDENVSSVNTYQSIDDDACNVQKLSQLRNCIFVCLTLFVFRDFSCVHLFKKIIHCIFAELNAKPVTYEQCTLLVTTLQLVFTIPTVFMVEAYGRKKLLLISSLGMLLAATGLELIMFNSNAIAAPEIRLVCIMSALLVYILFFAQGIGSIPWAMPFKNIEQNVRSFTLGFIISAHFLFLMIVELLYINEKHIYSEHSNAAYWLMSICIFQTIFVIIFL